MAATNTAGPLPQNPASFHNNKTNFIDQRNINAQRSGNRGQDICDDNSDIPDHVMQMATALAVLFYQLEHGDLSSITRTARCETSGSILDYDYVVFYAYRCTENNRFIELTDRATGRMLYVNRLSSAVQIPLMSGKPTRIPQRDFSSDTDVKQIALLAERLGARYGDRKFSDMDSDDKDTQALPNQVFSDSLKGLKRGKFIASVDDVFGELERKNNSFQIDFDELKKDYEDFQETYLKGLYSKTPAGNKDAGKYPVVEVVESVENLITSIRREKLGIEKEKREEILNAYTEIKKRTKKRIVNYQKDLQEIRAVTQRINSIFGRSESKVVMEDIGGKVTVLINFKKLEKIAPIANRRRKPQKISRSDKNNQTSAF
ncbi:hypothetical protein ACFL4E_02935 [Candidatus Omnitrophota bacterium]